MGKCVGVLTSGGDCPGLNAAIRGVGKAAIGMGMTVLGFHDGFRGLMENRFTPLGTADLSGILTLGGTILGTSRDKPHKMPVGGKLVDMTDAIVDNCRRNNLDVLVCIGGGGTLKNAYRLSQRGVKAITLPKTIDNDVPGTDVTFGFDTALGVATEAIDRLHSTAHSHHRVMVVEVMGHRTGWLTLGAGLAGGADVILIPEMPYDIEHVAEAIIQRRREGKHFSIVAVAEGALSREEARSLGKAVEALKEAKGKKEREEAQGRIASFEQRRVDNAVAVSKELERLTGLEARVTVLGYLQRGGGPSAADRILATKLGAACANLICEGVSGVMAGVRGDRVAPTPFEEIVGKTRFVPADHPWIACARNMGVCLGRP